MRPSLGLTALLLMVPATSALMVEQPAIHLEGHPDDANVLVWTVTGGELLSLDLVLVREGAVEVISLHPEARSYTDSTPPGSNTTYMLFGEFDNGVTTSNAYDRQCPFAGRQDHHPYFYVEPKCLPAIIDRPGWQSQEAPVLS